MQFTMTLSATNFSCIWRVNCENDNAVRFVSSQDPQAINNVYATTVMPMEFRGLLVGLMVANLVVICVWNYFLVNRVCMGIQGDSDKTENVVLTEVQIDEAHSK